MKKEVREQLESKQKKQLIDVKFTITLALVAFLLSVSLSFISEIAMKDVNLVIGIVVILVFIFIAIIFDTIGVAVTAADEAPFHAMSSKKIKGAKMAVKLKKNAEKTSTFCCDVIGDVCGVISGAAGVAVSTKMSEVFNISLLVCGLIVAGFIAAFTIGGKSVEKPIAINNGNKILYEFAKILSIFSKN